ncbi:sugar phosphate isomerase/epimerase family protein [Naasia aerilata]|uniref:sugar phosphate isomerase/epimerase family protein n=1 Tax=Naasia aerilata TaxID=1162966 RepID=UPI002572C1F0|nr:hypothetical protein [Naasia aerilata]
MTAGWSYALNQWRQSPTSFVRLEEHERAFKTVSAAGFRAVELWAGTGRWSNLGRPEHLRLNYGSAAGFLDRLAECGIDAVSSLTWDPSAPAAEEGFELRSTSRPADHGAILRAAETYLELLSELGCERIVVRATEPAGRLGSGFDAAAVASVLDRLGAAAQDHGVRVAVDIDCLSPSARPTASRGCSSSPTAPSSTCRSAPRISSWRASTRSRSSATTRPASGTSISRTPTSRTRKRATCFRVRKSTSCRGTRAVRSNAGSSSSGATPVSSTLPLC